LVEDPDIDDLFHGFGPLATFAQRISIAYALGAIDKGTMDELRALKEIRNHFAHHPMDAKFENPTLVVAAGTDGPYQVFWPVAKKSGKWEVLMEYNRHHPI